MNTNSKVDNDIIKRIDGLADLLDSKFGIPGTKIRFGLDALLGLIPGVGDVVAAALSLWIVVTGIRLGVSFPTVIKMLVNIGVELLFGSFPVLGDLFDVVWQANNRNVHLLREELAPGSFESAGEDGRHSQNQKRLLILLAVIILIGTAASFWHAQSL